MGNQNSVQTLQCENVCCDGHDADGNPAYPVTSYPLFGDDREFVEFEPPISTDDVSAPPGRVKSAASPLTSPDTGSPGVAAAKVFGVVAAEGDKVPVAEI